MATPATATARTLAAAMLLAAATTGVQSEPVQWVGLGSNNLWDDPANWNPIKIPQPTDDVTLPPNSNAMIGTSNGATAYSLTVADNSTLKVVGSNATFGSGGVQINGHSLVHLDSGAYPFTSTGPLRIGGTSRVDWYSGSIVSEVQVGSGAALVVEGAGAHFLTKDVQLAPSSVLVVQGPVLAGFWGTVRNNGGLVHVNGSAGAHLTNINITSTNGGRFVIDGVPSAQIQVDTIQADSLSLGTGISVKNTARLTNVVCNGCSGGYFGGLTYLTSWSGGGQVSVGAGASMYLSGKNRFEGLSSYGQLQCLVGDITAGALHISKQLRIDHQCPVQADMSSFGNDLFATGDGTISVGQSQWFGTIRIGQGLTFRAEKQLAFNGVNSVLLDGLLDLPTGSVLNVTSTGTVIAVSILAKPGRLNNNGTIVITGVPRPSKLVLTYAAYTGQGGVALEGNATLDVENTAFQPQALALVHPLAKATGEGCRFGWGALVGAAPGNRFSIIGDGSFEQCSSPCPLRPGRAYQNFEVLPAGAKGQL